MLYCYAKYSKNIGVYEVYCQYFGVAIGSSQINSHSIIAR